jgi:hypothetical protein
VTSRNPGWYEDPKTPETLRLWDGSAWTDRTRPAHDRDAPHTRPTRAIAVAVGVAIAVLGTAWAVSTFTGGATHGAIPPTPTTVAPDAACGYANRRPAPSYVVQWFSHTILTVRGPQAIPTPPGACRAAIWADARGPGDNLIIAYPTSAAANAAAVKLVGASNAVVFAEGFFMVALNGSLTADASDYRSKLARFVAGSGSFTGSPPTTTRI